jgi:nucleoside 2-deoxyribosyltransferase
MRNTQSKPFALVLMPFSEKFRDIYEVGIKPACKDAGANCERIDEQIYSENILERIYDQIRKADIIISEMTGRNANVFYETGYAHGQGKRVVLLTQEADDIPFDLKPYPHIVYKGSIATLKNELERRMRWYVERLTGLVETNGLDKDSVGRERPSDMKPLFSVR